MVKTTSPKPGCTWSNDEDDFSKNNDYLECGWDDISETSVYLECGWDDISETSVYLECSWDDISETRVYLECTVLSALSMFTVLRLSNIAGFSSP